MHLNTTNQLKILIISLLLLTVTETTSAQGRKKQRKIDDAVSYARGYIGTPYRMGGTSKSGIDCSGLIQKSYATIGIDLPRTAQAQAKVGSKKGEGKVRPGDIVFFKFKQKGEKWWHTGMITYADNDKIKFIHASTSRGVVEDTYNDYYEKNTKYFRRVIK